MTEMIALRITSNISSLHSERRFPANLKGCFKVGELKGKLELLTGVNSAGMTIELKDPDTGAFLSSLEDDAMSLARAGAKSGLVLHVRDTAGVSSLITTASADEEAIAKVEMSDEAYAARSDSVRAWKQQQRLGRFDPARQEKEATIVAASTTAAEELTVGRRCEVRLPNAPPRRGKIAYVGPVHFKSGHWVGVQYDEPLGKNDGSIDGKRYFEAPMKYGGFVRATDVVQGDFPELSLEDMDEF